jgi:dipeptide/tripeptide permease
MARVRMVTGAVLLMAAAVLLGLGVAHVRDQDFVGALILVAVGYGVLRTGAELLRPAMGE